MNWLTVPLFLLVVACGAPGRAQSWSEAHTPAPGTTQVFGFYTAGCIQGARALPTEGPGYEAIRLSRNRNWGHPTTIDYVRQLADKVRRAGQTHLYIRDIGQPRGGPMSTGHSSHQNGLDVDISYERSARPALPPAQREQVAVRSLLRADQRALDDTVFSDQHVTLLRLAAEPKNVDRIFVNRFTKKRLCESVTGNRGWIARIVPWSGHDSYFHVRLRCPPGQPQCLAQAEIGGDDGSGDALDLWFRAPPSSSLSIPSGPRTENRSRLPLACDRVLSAP